MTNASSQPMVTIAVQTVHPLTVCVRRWIEFSGKIWKKTARDVTSEYKIPTMMMVGRVKAAAGRPYLAISEP
jgi:hypothetical protein